MGRKKSESCGDLPENKIEKAITAKIQAASTVELPRVTFCVRDSTFLGTQAGGTIPRAELQRRVAFILKKDDPEKVADPKILVLTPLEGICECPLVRIGYGMEAFLPDWQLRTERSDLWMKYYDTILQVLAVALKPKKKQRPEPEALPPEVPEDREEVQDLATE